MAVAAGVAVGLVGVGATLAVRFTSGVRPAEAGDRQTAGPSAVSRQSVSPTQLAFDASAGAILPRHRVVAFYAVPGAAQTGPAHSIGKTMLARLKTQGAVYERLDPAHPVKLGIDLVVSVPDRHPGGDGSYSHHVDATTIQRYVDFCRANDLLLFLDLNFGWSDPTKELDFFRPYLKLPFVHVAFDPEWMFPRHNGIPGENLSNVRASDLNPLIKAVAEMPQQYRVPRKIIILHQYRPNGDGKANPFDPKAAILADKRNLVDDRRVDLVVHVDSVGGWPGDIGVKQRQYAEWVRRDMARFGNFRYGGFKIFYWLESRNRLMTPAEIMALEPAPMVITYGH
jgi:hypothetical protein